MRKGQHLIDVSRAPIYFTPTDIIDPVKEQFIDITDNMVPGILPYYMISNYGRLFHKYQNKYLTVNLDSKGYPFKPLHLLDGTQKNVRIHRLVALGFMYKPGCENLYINHIDGNKSNSCIWNLEWVTHRENMDHAKDNGLVKQSYSKDLIIKICEYLENPNMTFPQISESTGAPISLISAIQRKSSHTDISDNYNIQPRKIVCNLSNDQVEQLCAWYQANPKEKTELLINYCTKGLNNIGINNPDTKMIRAAKKIYNRETYNYISESYIF